MLKWKFLAAVGVVLGAAGVSWGYVQQQQAFPGVYELRIYQAESGKRDALAARFASRTAAIYERHGITNVGFFIPKQSVPELGIDADNTFIYILGFPSQAEREKRLKGRATDPEFRELVIEGEKRPETHLIRQAFTIEMAPSGRYSAIKITP